MGKRRQRKSRYPSIFKTTVKQKTTTVKQKTNKKPTPDSNYKSHGLCAASKGLAVAAKFS